jgi:hypothetical protein
LAFAFPSCYCSFAENRALPVAGKSAAKKGRQAYTQNTLKSSWIKGFPAVVSPFSALSLLVTGLGADHADHSVTLDDFAFAADPLH